jgi:outer membrane protein assembly factor BamB
MRGYQVRLLSCALLAAAVAWAVSSGDRLLAQKFGGAQPLPPVGKKKDAKEKEERSELDENLPFAVPYERDSKRQLQAVQDYLKFKDPTNIPWGEVCGLLQRILDSKSDSFFDVKYKVGEAMRINRISVKTEANRIIATFSPEGLQFYQQAEGQKAAAVLDDAVKANYDLAVLSDLSQRYFHTKAGAQGTVLLATIYLERGNYLEAAYAFERLAPRKDIDDLFTPMTLFKACLAFKRSGDPRHAELYQSTLARLDKAARNGVQIGRTTYTADKLRAELERPVELLQKSELVGEWPMRGGSPARAAVVDGGPPFLVPAFKAPLFPPDAPDTLEGNNWIRGELEKLFAHNSRSAGKAAVPLPGAFPVTTPDLVVFRGYDGVYGVATRDTAVGGEVVRAGTVRWRSKTTAGLHQLQETDPDDVDMKRDTQNWWNTYSSRTVNVSSILYENPLIGTLAHDGHLVYFVDDVAITPPPVYSNPDFGIVGQPQFRHSGALADKVRAGRLAAVDMRTGMLKWELGRVPLFDGAPPRPPLLNEEEADKTTDAFRLCLDAVFLGAPLPLNGKLYVLIEQAGSIRLLCLDPKNLVQVPGQTRKPALVWSQKLGKPNNPLPQDSVRRYQGANLAASEGILVCPTNCGMAVAVDIMSRSLLWAHGYHFLENNAPRQPFPQPGMPNIPQQLPTDRWRSAGPIISNGRVVLSAYDSPNLECLDLRTGKVLWSVPRDPNDLYVAGVAKDRVVVVGKTVVKAYQLTGEDKTAQTRTPAPKLAWQSEPIPTPTGHGALSRDAYYVPVRQENAGKDPTTPAGEIWAIRLSDGQVASKTAARKRNDTAELAKYGIGNLVFQDGMVFSQSPWEVACYPQLGQKLAEMNKLLAANPKDPLGLLARGELRLDDGKLKEAVADFKEAAKNDLPPEKRPLLREKLYIAYTELLRADFNSAESFMKEYEALCEIPAEPNEAPEDKARRGDEIKRRKRQFQFLLARGREGQGRLGEAFDHYLALANLGEGKQLIDMPDEPNVKMRPDVWARGRIESMIRRAATPEAKKSLEVRVNKEWAQVKAGNDLNQLREFVAVFGPFFEAGREAQFKLADVLLSTRNEADAREAQTHLSQLRVAAEDPATRARATEALAKLMIDNRMMEDAVGLYLQLGKEYADVVVRDGKTGADFLNGLLTDKRLLPYLEPTRYPLPARVKARDDRPVTTNNPGAQFEIESPPDLFPAFRQYRFVLDQYRSGNGSWTLIGYDRATGSEKCRFPNMVAPNLYTNNGYPIPYSKFVQGTGHILLVQLGMWVHCFDLAEKKELWSRNLLGENPPVVQPGVNPNPPVQVLPNGACVVRFPDGYTVTLGRSTIVQPGYVAILTRDGLECVEPLTRRTLWTRTGIGDRTEIVGDGRYIVLIENDEKSKPHSTKLLRAVDGMVVEKSPDSGRVLGEAQSYRLFGRHALLSSGSGAEKRTLRLYDLATGKDVWKKEFDPKAIPINTPLNPEWTGVVTPDGTAEVISARTGASVAKLKVDAKNVEAHVKPAVGAQLLADAERFYLVLDRDPNAQGPNGTRPVPIFNNYMLRSQKVNGPIYAFDRAAGKRLWYFADVLEHQWLVLEQFADLPVIIASAPVMNQNNAYTHPVVVIEKDRGRLVFNKSVQYNGNFFMSLTADPKYHTISMNRYDIRIVISPDDAKK